MITTVLLYIRLVVLCSVQRSIVAPATAKNQHLKKKLKQLRRTILLYVLFPKPPPSSILVPVISSLEK